MPLGAYRSLRKSGASAEKDRLVKSFAKILGAFVLFIFVAMFLLTTGCDSTPSPPKNCETLVVLKVGGCDKYGECGVILSNQEKTRVRYPVEGQTFDVCK